jgi:SpoVK/Ycf46/Vps4 family AAA+-type ATPase
LYVEDKDFCAIDKQIERISNDVSVYEYSNAHGAIDFKTKNSVWRGEPSLASFLRHHKDSGFDRRVFLILKDVHNEISNPEIIALLRHIAEHTMNTEDYFTTVFIISGIRKIPKELEHLVTLVAGEQPGQNSIESIIRNYGAAMGFSCSESDIGSLALEMKGLSEFQINQTLNLAYCNGGSISFEKDRELIFAEKKQMVEKSGLLEFIEAGESLTNVGGLGMLKQWLLNKARIFAQLDSALKRGVDRPKGVLILGMPGCGKSLTAKTTASLFGTPLVRLDIGRLLGKYVGESEDNMRAALALSEAISPCVLWIDEIEKAFAGGGQSGGHEVTVRLIGQFLTWMQEKKNTVFVVATANNITALPPEFLRKGRFDEIFSVDLPDKEERLEILRIHLEKRGQLHRENRHQLDLFKIVNGTEDFSGADIEGVVASAVEHAFLADKPFVNTQDLLDAAKKTNPLAKILEEEITTQRKKLQSYGVVNAKRTDGTGNSQADTGSVPAQCLQKEKTQFGIPYNPYVLVNTTPCTTDKSVGSQDKKNNLEKFYTLLHKVKEKKKQQQRWSPLFGQVSAVP